MPTINTIISKFHKTNTVKLLLLAATLFSVLLQGQISGYLIWRSQRHQV